MNDATPLSATPLPWKLSDDGKAIVTGYYRDEEPEICCQPTEPWDGGWDGDAELILHRVNSFDDLVAALDELRRAVSRHFAREDDEMAEVGARFPLLDAWERAGNTLAKARS